MTRHATIATFALLLVGFAPQAFALTPAQKQAAIQVILTEHAVGSTQIHARAATAAKALETRIQAELTQTQAASLSLTVLRNELTMAAAQAAALGNQAAVETLLQGAVRTAVTQVTLSAAQRARIQIYTATFAAVVHQANVAQAQLNAWTQARIQAVLNS